MERGRRFESNESEVVALSDLPMIDPHVATAKKFRRKL